MKVLLVEPERYRDWGPHQQYLGLLRIGNYHQCQGHTVEYVCSPAKPHTFDYPDLIHVTSMFTYWYKNVWKAVRHYKKLYPNAQVWLGGIYVTLCPEHARQSGADYVMVGQHPQAKDYAPDPTLIPYPTDFSYMMTSWGCNRACTYCATHLLYGTGIRQMSPEQLVEELDFLKYVGINKIWLGDDNILHDHENHIDKLCETIIRKRYNLEIHLPGGMSAKDFTQETAYLMRRAGFKEISFALESVSHEVLKQMGRGSNVHIDDLSQALGYADKAGFRRIDTNVYFIIGLPYQGKEDILDTLFYLVGQDVWAHPQRFTPIPGTVDFNRLGLEGVDLADLHYKTYTAPGQDSHFLNDVYAIARYCNMGARYATWNLLKSGYLVRSPVVPDTIGRDLKIMTRPSGDTVCMVCHNIIPKGSSCPYCG